ncbi:phosphatase phospho-type [Hyaloraphidium curvatum]|nr:phosphatase phospho-type [Hyaloraphidium curvatum]
MADPSSLTRSHAADRDSGRAERAAGRTLVMFDFDQTILPVDSDREIFVQLGLPEYNSTAAALVRGEGRQWTELMDEMLVRAQDHLRVGAPEVLAAVARAEFDATMDSLLRQLGALPHADAVILSDANDAYISAILDAQTPPLSACFAGVVTNPSHVDHLGRLRIRKRRTNADPAAGKRHERCANGCPENLCKGEEADRLLYGVEPGTPVPEPAPPRTYARAVYVGDGGNDYCPSARLLPSDVVLARRGFALERRIARAAEAGMPIRARVEYWETYVELAEHFAAEVPGLAAAGVRL